jgi:hypothetical protein
MPKLRGIFFFFYKSSLKCLWNCRRPAKFGAQSSGSMIGRGHDNLIDLWIPQLIR